MKRLLPLTLLLVSLLLPSGALAAEKLTGFYVSVLPTDGGEMPADAVSWYETSGGKYYLFLPGAADLADARVWFTGISDVTLAGETLKSGDPLPALAPGESLDLTAGRKTYTVHVMQGSAIGALFLETQSGSTAYIHRSKNNKEPGALRLLNPDGTLGYDGALEHIKVRGNTSTTFSKKNYGFKLENGADVLGMGKAKRWVLVGNARDHSLLRNQITLSMAHYAGLTYTPETRQAEFYINHEYRGTYTLHEKIEINDERVAIADLKKATEAVNDQELDAYPTTGPTSAKRGQFKAYQIPNNPEDITGGYLLEYENYQPRYKSEACAYTTARGKVILIKDPEEASVEQLAYISAFIQGYENAIFAPDGIDPETGKHYSEFVDFDSLVKKYMLEEISMNCDGNASSQFYYKPADSQSAVAFAGPAWDYDTSYGDYARENSRRLLNPEILYHTNVNASQYWWPQLYQKEEFLAGVRAAWADSYAPAVRILLGLETDPAGELLSIRAYAAVIEDSAAMNFARWPIKQSSTNFAKTGKTFAENIDYLQNFLRRRYDFLSGEWGE